MKRFAMIILAGCAASPAVAQPSLSTYAQLGLYYGNTPALRSVSINDSLICLRRIESGERVCHTRSEWRQVAAEMTRREIR